MKFRLQIRGAGILAAGLLLIAETALARVLGPGDFAILDYAQSPPQENYVIAGGELEVRNLPGDVDPLVQDIILESGELVFQTGSNLNSLHLPLHIYAGQSVTLPSGVWFTGDTLAVVEGGSLQMQDCIVEMSMEGIIAENPASLVISDCVFSGTSQPLITLAGGGMSVSNTRFLTAGTALELSPSGAVVIDSCLFQGNEWGLVLFSGGNKVELQHCDFVDPLEQHLVNYQPSEVCHLWDCFLDDSTESGDGFLVAAAPGPHFSKEIPRQVILSDVDLPHEPEDVLEVELEWDPVGLSENGFPLKVEGYNIYLAPENPYRSEGWQFLMFVPQSGTIAQIPDGITRGFITVKAVIGPHPDE
jgi:hypothetical protein